MFFFLSLLLHIPNPRPIDHLVRQKPIFTSDTSTMDTFETYLTSDFEKVEPTMIPPSPTHHTDETQQKENGKNKEARLPFPCKVYDMLEDADQQCFQHIVSWNSEGAGFMVHNKELFTKEIVPHYFNQTKYKSFQRQLSLYGFQRKTSGKSKGLRYHEKLIRGSRNLCREMKPVGYKPRGKEKKKSRPKQNGDKASSKPIPRVTIVEQGPIPSDGPVTPNLPAVVSSNSLCKEEQQRDEPLPVSPELSSIRTNYGIFSSQDLISSDDIGFFEGMPFYLMNAVSESRSSDSGEKTFTESVPPVVVDGLLKKAWEIGFQVAMAMNPSSFTNVMDTVSVDALDVAPRAGGQAGIRLQST